MGICGTDNGYMSVHSVSRPKARKKYQCQECSKKIEPGDIYRRDFMVWEGEAETAICCAGCDELMVKFFTAVPSDYRHEITFEVGGLHAAIIELRDEFGAAVDGFDYPQEPQP